MCWCALLVDRECNRGIQIFLPMMMSACMHACMHFFPHNLFDGESDMHAPSCHHHLSRFCTGEEVHATHIFPVRVLHD